MHFAPYIPDLKEGVLRRGLIKSTPELFGRLLTDLITATAVFTETGDNHVWLLGCRNSLFAADGIVRFRTKPCVNGRQPFAVQPG